jgi:hypothetical protein
MRRTVFGLIFLVFSYVQAAAGEDQDWLKALMLFDAGRYEESLELLTPLAEAGNVDAQEILYASYTYGYGVTIDHAKALDWLRRSAELGDADAQDAMGHHCFTGTGVKQDDREAMRWFRLAAGQGNASAIYNLGVMTMNGHGTEADLSEAWRLIQWAAELDNPDALFLVAGAAMQAAPSTGSIDLAMDYLARAAQLGQRQASALLGVVLEDFPEDPQHRLKSAFHYQAAVLAGCEDVREAAARAVARLSPDERAALDYNLALWLPKTDPRDPQPVKGQCLAG